MSQVALKHYQQFEEILKDYAPAARAKAVLKDLKLVLLIAPTSGGRNTIIRYQLGTGKYYYIVSDTTRPPRMNDGVMERNGKEYWFRTEEEMLSDLEAGEFLEAEILHRQQVSGISIRELAKAQNENKVAITDIDIEGMHNILRAKPDTVAIMLLPPSFDEWQRRLDGRGVMQPEERKRRLETAEKIFQDGLKESYYHFIITENIEQSAGIIDAIVKGGSNPHQGRAHETLNHLLETLQDRLSNPF
jgi:guanylate kinase